jgi:energy-coupling factor transport system substrate-specific component
MSDSNRHAGTLMNRQIFRFLVMGGLAAAINWLVRFPLSALMPFEGAVFVAYLIGMTAGLVLCWRYVFVDSDRSKTAQTLYFLAVNALSAVLVTILASLSVKLLSPLPVALWVREGLGHGLAIGIGIVFNFLGQRTVTFTASDRSDGERH